MTSENACEPPAPAAGGTFTQGNNVVVFGQISEHAALQLPSLNSCQATFTGTSGGDVSLEPGQTRTLTGARYGNIVVKSRATLQLPPGTVEIRSLDLEPGATLTVSPTQITQLLVSGSVIWRGTSSAPLFLGIFSTGTTYLEAPFSGAVVQPQGTVVIRALNGASLLGQVVAQNVSVDAHAIVMPAYLFGAVPTGSTDSVTACDGLCSPPNVFASGFATVDINGDAACLSTSAGFLGGTCGNFGTSRPLS